MEIQVTIKHVYGEAKIYPSCRKAVTFARMLGQKTLTPVDIENIKTLGFKVSVVQEKKEL